MITVETYNYNYGERVGYSGYGSTVCPYCDCEVDVGTGEHAIPDCTKCSCGKWFKYWPSGHAQRVNPKRQAELNKEVA